MSSLEIIPSRKMWDKISEMHDRLVIPESDITLNLCVPSKFIWIFFIPIAG